MRDITENIENMLDNVDKILSIQELYEDVLDSLPWGLAVIDDARRVILINDVLAEVTDMEGLLGNSIDRIVDKKCRGFDDQDYATIMLKSGMSVVATMYPMKLRPGYKTILIRNSLDVLGQHKD